MAANDRMNFGSKLGIIMASAGSAVGLGNVWRFPSETGANGGSAFLLVYLGCVVFLGVPVMISEFLIGRHSRANTAAAYQILAPGTHWRWVGLLGVTTGFLILGYYSVVAGWTLYYSYLALINQFSGLADSKALFDNFVSNPYLPILGMVLVMLVTHFIIVRGVESGIEAASKIMMPLLFIIVLVLVFCSFTLSGAKEGLTFFLKPDFGRINSKVVLSAMGQAFFSLSLGMGCLCTYASYFKKDTSLTKTAFSVAAIDTLIAVMAGLIIFPAVYSVPGLKPDEGASLAFVTLPKVFQIVFHGVPVLAYLSGLLFYVLLFLAAVTSTISLHEVSTAYFHETYHFSRRKAAWIVTCGCIFLGIFCSLSYGPLNGVKLFGKTIFDMFDFVTAKIMLPFGGMFIAIFTGWYLDRKLVRDEVTNYGTLRVRTFRIFIFIIRYIAPVAIGLIFINELLFK